MNSDWICKYGETSTCKYRCVEDFKGVLLVVVSSGMVACGGRNGRRNTCCHVAGAAAVVPVVASPFSWDDGGVSGVHGVAYGDEKEPEWWSTVVVAGWPRERERGRWLQIFREREWGAVAVIVLDGRAEGMKI